MKIFKILPSSTLFLLTFAVHQNCMSMDRGEEKTLATHISSSANPSSIQFNVQKDLIEAKPINIRAIKPTDLPALKYIIDASKLFPSDMLDDMTAGYFSGAAINEFWLTVDEEGPVAVAYYAPERMTQGTWNLLLIAVHPDTQRQGLGAALLNHVELALAKRGARLLLIETSNLPIYDRARAFYLKFGYGEEARIRDFYEAGEDKIIFRKKLTL